MKVLVLSRKTTITGQMKDLKQQVSLYFKSSSNIKVILQHFEKEWDHIHLDLDEADTIHDHDKLQVIVISEPTPAKEKLDNR